MRKMFDSTAAVDIPPGSELVMGYVDGSSAWSAADWQLFPDRTIVRLCVFNDRMDAQVIDIEPGNNDAKGAVPWIREKWLRGQTPTVYCFSDRGPHGYTISDIRSECDAASLKHPLFLITDFDNNPGAFNPAGDPTIIGKQYANAALTGGHFDASVVADHWPGVDPDVVAPTAPPLFSQSPDPVTPVGTVAELAAGWSYRQTDGTYKAKFVIKKVWSGTPGRQAVVLHPPVDPDNDPTEILGGQNAVFVVTFITRP